MKGLSKVYIVIEYSRAGSRDVSTRASFGASRVREKEGDAHRETSYRNATRARVFHDRGGRVSNVGFLVGVVVGSACF